MADSSPDKHGEVSRWPVVLALVVFGSVLLGLGLAGGMFNG